MTTMDDHWPTTLQRVVASLDFEIEEGGRERVEIRARVKTDSRQVPALVDLALQAALEVDRRVAASDAEPPIDRKAVLARKDLSRAMTDGAHSMFLTGYATAYRLELARILWAGIADAPRRRLEELARPRVS
jgi:hypothetical protein